LGALRRGLTQKMKKWENKGEGKKEKKIEKTGGTRKLDRWSRFQKKRGGK